MVGVEEVLFLGTRLVEYSLGCFLCDDVTLWMSADCTVMLLPSVVWLLVREWWSREQLDGEGRLYRQRPSARSPSVMMFTHLFHEAADGWLVQMKGLRVHVKSP
jgi:hypothetical protein